MEAAGAPRLDAERRELVRRSTRGAGQRGQAWRDKSGVAMTPPMPRRLSGTASARHMWRAFGHLRARDAGDFGPSIRPVLKHGPRSLACVRAGGWQTH